MNASHSQVPRPAAPVSLSTRRRVVAMLGYVLLFLAMVGLDQTTKWHAEKTYMAYSDPVNSEIYRASSTQMLQLGDRTGNWFELNFTYLRNHGAVWGVFSDMPEVWRLTLFYSVTVVAVFGVLFLFRRTPRQQVLYRLALIFILAGAVGNFVDRLLLKYVIDFLHPEWSILGWAYNFPVFNVADISIDVGIGLMLLDMVLVESAKRRATRVTTASGAPAVA